MQLFTLFKNYTIPSNNRELRPIPLRIQTTNHYTIPSNNRELRPCYLLNFNSSHHTEIIDLRLHRFHFDFLCSFFSKGEIISIYAFVMRLLDKCTILVCGYISSGTFDCHRGAVVLEDCLVDFCLAYEVVSVLGKSFNACSISQRNLECFFFHVILLPNRL